MRFAEVAAFEVVQEKLSWPWIAIDPSGTRVAFPESSGRIASRVLERDAVVAGPSFDLPGDLALPTEPPPQTETHDMRAGLHAFAIAPDGGRLVLTGIVGAASTIMTLDANGEPRRSSIDELVGPGFIGRAVIFERSGARVWLSAESTTETAILLLDASTHAPIGILKSPPLPPPATHELFVHPREDAVLLLAACGPYGTFARVARFAQDSAQAVWTSLDGGGISAGMVGFSADAKNVYLAEADELRTHAWPGLKETSSMQFEEDFVSSYSGAVVSDRVLVDGEDYETKEDAVTVFDAKSPDGRFVIPPVPTGMWVGRLGGNYLVTVEAKGTPARALVVRVDDR